MGTTIGKVLISYDIDELHTSVKKGLEDLGYYDSFHFANSDDNKTYHLPNTTLWHKSKSSNQAMTDLKNVCNNLGVKIQKAIAVKATEFVGY